MSFFFVRKHQENVDGRKQRKNECLDGAEQKGQQIKGKLKREADGTVDKAKSGDPQDQHLADQDIFSENIAEKPDGKTQRFGQFFNHMKGYIKRDGNERNEETGDPFRAGASGQMIQVAEDPVGADAGELNVEKNGQRQCHRRIEAGGRGLHPRNQSHDIHGQDVEKKGADKRGESSAARSDDAGDEIIERLDRHFDQILELSRDQLGSAGRLSGDENQQKDRDPGKNGVLEVMEKFDHFGRGGIMVKQGNDIRRL